MIKFIGQTALATIVHISLKGVAEIMYEEAN